MTADQNTTEDFALKTSDSDTTNTSNGHDNESVTTKLITIEESEDVDHVRVYPSDLNADTYINTSKSGEAKSTTPFSNDIGTWTLVSDQKREHFCKQGSFACHHHDNEFNASGRIFQGETFKRRRTKSLFFRDQLNGEKVQRDWICYSPSTGKLYCIICKLFSSPNEQSFLASSGYSDWKYVSRDLRFHESSSLHQSCIAQLVVRRTNSQRVHKSLIEQHES